MATVTTNITPTVRPFAFEGEGILAPGSDIPRRELRCTVLDVAVAATGAGDNQYVNCVLNLPAGQCYALADFFFALQCDTAGATNNFGTSVQLSFSNDAAAGDVRWQGEAHAQAKAVLDSAGAIEKYLYMLHDFPKTLMVPKDGDSQVTLSLNIYNTQANDGGYVANGLFRVLEYEVENAHYWPVNRPVLVR